MITSGRRRLPAEMPRYFFHAGDGADSLDRKGLVLADADDARAEVVRLASEVLSDLGSKFWVAPNLRMWVTDERGETALSHRWRSWQATRAFLQGGLGQAGVLF